MKYIKLFEEFRGTKDNSVDLIDALGRYKEIIEKEMGKVDTEKYFDILTIISDSMVKYRDIFEYVLRTRFDSESDRLYTIVRDLNSLFLDLESEGLSDQSRDIIREISDVLHKYSRMIEGVIDIHNYYSRSGDMEAMSRGMREESEMLEGIMVSHQRVERMWMELLMSFDSVNKFEEKRELLGAIMNLMVDIEDGDGLEARFEDLSRKVLSIIGDIIEALNNRVLGKRDGDGEIGRISQYYMELEKSEKLILELIDELMFYVSKGSGELVEEENGMMTQNDDDNWDENWSDSVDDDDEEFDDNDDEDYPDDEWDSNWSDS